MKTLEWIASLLCIASGLMLSSHFEYSGYGYILFLIAHIIFEYKFYKQNEIPILVNNTFFIAIDIWGIYRWM